MRRGLNTAWENMCGVRYQNRARLLQGLAFHSYAFICLHAFFGQGLNPTFVMWYVVAMLQKDSHHDDVSCSIVVRALKRYVFFGCCC